MRERKRTWSTSTRSARSARCAELRPSSPVEALSKCQRPNSHGEGASPLASSSTLSPSSMLSSSSSTIGLTYGVVERTASIYHPY